MEDEEIAEVPDDFASGYPEGGDSLGAFAGLTMGGIPSAAAINESSGSNRSSGSSQSSGGRKVSDEQAKHEKIMKDVEEKLRASGVNKDFRKPLKPLSDEEIAAKEARLEAAREARRKAKAKAKAAKKAGK